MQSLTKAEPLSDVITALFGCPVAVGIASVGTRPPSPWPLEEAHLLAVASVRLEEFRAGRIAAREALKRLGRPVVGLPPASDGSLVWPSEILGSLTHCPGLCAAVATEATVSGIGLDAEPLTQPFEQVARVICLPEELRSFANAEQPRACSWPALAFVAKESFIKAASGSAGGLPRFRDVRIVPRQGPGVFAFEGTGSLAPLAARAEGRVLVAGAWLLGGVTIA